MARSRSVAPDVAASSRAERQPGRLGRVFGWLGLVAAASLLVVALIEPDRSAFALRRPVTIVLALSALGVIYPIRRLGFGGRRSALLALLLAGATISVLRAQMARHRDAESLRSATEQASSGGDPFGQLSQRTDDAKARSEPGALSAVRIRPRLFQTDARSGGVETPGARFNAASLRYVGFELQVPDSVSGFSLGDCYFERLRTGVKLAPGTRITMQADGGVRIVGMLGLDQAAWLPGEYRLTCEGKGIAVEPRTFSVEGRWRGEPGLKIIAGKMPIPDATSEDLRLFHQDEARSVAPIGSRSYWSTVRGAPRYIAAELKIALKAAPRPIPFTYTCHYFTDEGGLIGKESTEVEIPAGKTEYYMWVSWGSGDGRYWRTGNHYVECDVDGVFAAGQFFGVKRR